MISVGDVAKISAGNNRFLAAAEASPLNVEAAAAPSVIDVAAAETNFGVSVTPEPQAAAIKRAAIPGAQSTVQTTTLTGLSVGRRGAQPRTILHQ